MSCISALRDGYEGLVVLRAGVLHAGGDRQRNGDSIAGDRDGVHAEDQRVNRGCLQVGVDEVRKLLPEGGEVGNLRRDDIPIGHAHAVPKVVDRSVCEAGHHVGDTVERVGRDDFDHGRRGRRGELLVTDTGRDGDAAGGIGSEDVETKARAMQAECLTGRERVLQDESLALFDLAAAVDVDVLAADKGALCGRDAGAASIEPPLERVDENVSHDLSEGR